jgi:hypothetical protein
MTFNTGNHTSVVPVGLGLGKVIQLDGDYTINAYAEIQPSLYRPAGAPNYQNLIGISLQLPLHSQAAGIFLERSRDHRESPPIAPESARSGAPMSAGALRLAWWRRSDVRLRIFCRFPSFSSSARTVLPLPFPSLPSTAH